MGGVHSGPNESRFHRFRHEELVMLQTMFQDLARRSTSEKNANAIEKETFLRVFKLPGMLGERLFAVFNEKKTGVIDFDEFIGGLSQIVRGNTEEKVKLLFKMYDLNGDGHVSKSELTTMLNSVFSAASFVADQAYLDYPPENNGEYVDYPEEFEKNSDEQQGFIRHNSDDDNAFMREEFNQAVQQMIDHAFHLHEDNQKVAESMHGAKDKMTVDDFRKFIEENPKLLQLLDHTFSLHSEDECESGSSDTEDYQSDTSTLSPKIAKRQSVMRLKKSASNSRLSSMKAKSHKHLFLDEIVTPNSVKQERTSHEDTGFTVHCTSCGLHFALSYCYRCGTPTTSANCDHCGRIFMGDGMKFCPSCGARAAKSMGFHESSSSLNIHSASKTNLSVNTNIIPLRKNSSEHFKLQKRQSSDFGRLTPKRNGSMSSIIGNVNVHSGKHKKGSVLDHFHPHHHHHAHMKGYLFKVGKKFHALTERYYILRDDFVYSFKRFDDIKPRHVLWLEGCFVEKIDDASNKNKKMKYGFEITVGTDETGSRVFYAADEHERDQWVQAIRTASHSFDIKDFYEIGKEIGVGKFSSVRIARNKKTSRKYAVKVIDRKALDKREREALRTEIAVLKLVNHPSIVHIKSVYETKDTIYIVMNLVEGGDLFDRIIKLRRFPENTAKSVIWKLLEVIKYLHDRGIVHRDLKPENIMVMDDTHDDDIVVGDFGLSKFTGPEELMKLPCGTLAYVAPEVLEGKGYGHEVDLWSVGIILYVLLRGRLPFDSEDKKTVIKMTMQGKLNFQSKYWAEITPDAKDLIRRLLDVNPQTRASVEEAQRHPWFEDGGHHSDDEHKHHHHGHGHSSLHGHTGQGHGQKSHNRFSFQLRSKTLTQPPSSAPHSHRHSFGVRRGDDMMNSLDRGFEKANGHHRSSSRGKISTSNGSNGGPIHHGLPVPRANSATAKPSETHGNGAISASTNFSNSKFPGVKRVQTSPADLFSKPKPHVGLPPRPIQISENRHDSKHSVAPLTHPPPRSHLRARSASSGSSYSNSFTYSLSGRENGSVDKLKTKDRCLSPAMPDQVYTSSSGASTPSRKSPTPRSKLNGSSGHVRNGRHGGSAELKKVDAIKQRRSLSAGGKSSSTSSNNKSHHPADED